VERFIENYPNLGKMFLKEGIAPLDYFRKNSNGAVTWAQNALRELSDTRDQDYRMDESGNRVPSSDLYD
jgi:hypothetical protein